MEDEIFVAMDIERILADAGYHVRAIAADRDTALAHADDVDLAFVDINLRDGQTGPSIACDLAQRSGAKVFYVTANPSQIEPVAATALGYIQKPFSPEAIIAAAKIAEHGSHPAPEAIGIRLFPRAS